LVERNGRREQDSAVTKGGRSHTWTISEEKNFKIVGGAVKKKKKHWSWREISSYLKLIKSAENRRGRDSAPPQLESRTKCPGSPGGVRTSDKRRIGGWREKGNSPWEGWRRNNIKGVHLVVEDGRELEKTLRAEDKEEDETKKTGEKAAQLGTIEKGNWEVPDRR